MTMRLLTLSTLLCSAAFAQVGGPFLGYVPEGPHLRPLYGLPAAGSIGAAIQGRAFSHVALPPEQSFALVSTADTGQVFVASEVLTGGFNLTSVTGASANPEILAMAPSGASAALFFPNGHLQIVTGMPNSPTARDIDASFLNASPLALAVSDDGLWAVGIFPAGSYAFGPTAQVMNLQTDPAIVALAFFHNSHNLALANAKRATSIADVGGANQLSVLYDYSQQSLSPRALAVSFDNQRAVVADASGKIVNINIPGLTAAISDCACSPTGVDSLGGSVFRLTTTGRTGTGRSTHSTDLKVFDASAGAVWIVPPALSISETGARQ